MMQKEYEITCKKSGRKYIIKSGIKKEELTKELNDYNTKFTFSPSGWTNGNVKVSVKTTVQSYTLQTSKDGKNWDEASEQTFTANGTMYVRLWDGKASVSEMTYKVANIDKKYPESICNSTKH